MNGFSRLLILVFLLFSLTHCATTDDGGGEAMQDLSNLDSSSGGESASSESFEASSDKQESKQTESSSEGDQLALDDNKDQSQEQKESTSQAKDDELSLDENNSEKKAENNEPQKDEFAELELDQKDQAKQEQPPPSEPPQELAPPPQEQAKETPPPAEPPVEPAPPAAPVADSKGIVNLSGIQFKGNDNGGTVVVQADGPLTYSTRLNPQSNQFIVEIPYSIMPKKLARALVTKDFKGTTIGSIDAYQNKGTNLSRIVVQLRPGAPEPIVQAEGNSLLIVAGQLAPAAPPEEVAQTQVPPPAPVAPPQAPMNPSPVAEPAEETSESESKLLAYESLEQFLNGNMSFYGKKISIETDDMDLRDIFKLISEEGSINMVISDDIRGKMSLKLRNVPWDQALVMIMKSKKLGYTRTGNVLRIAPAKDIRDEEKEIIDLAESKKKNSPLKVKLIPISYAKVDEMEKQSKPFLSPRGTIVVDARTSALVVSDIDENIERIQKLVQSIDVPPQQVMIEGKVVEASEQFERNMGINWFTSGKGASAGGNLKSTTSFQVSPGLITDRSFSLNFNMGTLDFFGDLGATLNLKEREGLVKVLSSPRVVTLHNETAEISQTTELPLITATVNNGVVTPSVTFKQVKLKLSVKPQISNDGGVIMAVDVSRDIPGDVVNAETQARPINSRAAKTNVIVKNGQTAVIGGIYQNDAQEGETRVPGLGSIPILGWLFKSKSRSTQKTELLIFLTPRIVGQLDAGLSAGTLSPLEPLAPKDSASKAPKASEAKNGFEDGLDLDSGSSQSMPKSDDQPKTEATSPESDGLDF